MKRSVVLFPLASILCGLSAVSTAVAQDPPTKDQATRPNLSRAEVERIIDEYLKRTSDPRQGVPAESDSALDRLQVFGDLRVREEYAFQQFGKPDRNRVRLRLRVGASFSLSEEWELGARLRTGDPDDPNSPHVTLGDGFDSLEINLDRAFLVYHPDWSAGSSVYAGKFNHSFARNPVYGELVWDADVQPEGLLFSYAPQSGEPGGFLRDFSVKAAAYSLVEQGGGSDALVGAAEVRASIGVVEDVASWLSVAYYHYGDTSPDGNLGLVGDNRGNATVDTSGDGKVDSFVSHFGVLHAIVGVSHDAWGMPVTVGGDFIHNVRAEMVADTGWSIGVSCGKSQRAGDVRGYYQWQVVERDAVFSALVQDDFLFATNHRSHVFGMDYQLRDDLGLHVWALVSAPHAVKSGGGADQDQWRLRFDVNVKF